MSRSIKKGPYVESALMKRIVEMNKSGKKNVPLPMTDLATERAYPSPERRQSAMTMRPRTATS